MLEAVGQNSKRQRLRPCHRLVPAISVRKNARQIRHFADPATVLFLFDFDCELAHIGIVHSSTRHGFKLPSRGGIVSARSRRLEAAGPAVWKTAFRPIFDIYPRSMRGL